jgi:hypothetical protein
VFRNTGDSGTCEGGADVISGYFSGGPGTGNIIDLSAIDANGQSADGNDAFVFV